MSRYKAIGSQAYLKTGRAYHADMQCILNFKEFKNRGLQKEIVYDIIPFVERKWRNGRRARFRF